MAKSKDIWSFCKFCQLLLFSTYSLISQAEYTKAGDGYQRAHQLLQQKEAQAKARKIARCPDNFEYARPGGAGWFSPWVDGVEKNCKTSTVYSNEQIAFDSYADFENFLQKESGFNPGRPAHLVSCFSEMRDNFKADSPEVRTQKMQFIMDYYHSFSRLEACVMRAAEGIAFIDRRIKTKGSSVLDDFNINTNNLPGLVSQVNEMKEDKACRANGKKLLGDDVDNLLEHLKTIDNLELQLREFKSREFRKDFIKERLSKHGENISQATREYKKFIQETVYSLDGLKDGSTSFYQMKAGLLSTIPGVSMESKLFQDLVKPDRDTHAQLRKENGVELVNKRGDVRIVSDFSAGKPYLHLEPELEQLESKEFKDEISEKYLKDLELKREALEQQANICMQAADCVTSDSSSSKCRNKIHKALKKAPKSSELEGFMDIAHKGRTPKDDSHGNIVYKRSEEFPNKNLVVNVDEKTKGNISKKKADRYLQSYGLYSNSQCRGEYSKELDEKNHTVNIAVVDSLIAAGTIGFGITATGVRVGPKSVGFLRGMLASTGVPSVYAFASKPAAALARTHKVKNFLSAGSKAVRQSKVFNMLKAAGDFKAVKAIQGWFKYGAKTEAVRSTAMHGYKVSMAADLSWAMNYIFTQGVPECREKLKNQVEEEGLALASDGKPEQMCEAEWLHQLEVAEGSYISCTVNVGMGLAMLMGTVPLAKQFRPGGAHAAEVSELGSGYKVFGKENPSEYVKKVAELGRKWNVQNLRRSWRGTDEVANLSKSLNKTTDEVDSLLTKAALNLVNDMTNYAQKTGKAMDTNLIGQLMMYAQKNPTKVLSQWGAGASKPRLSTEKLLNEWKQSLDVINDIKNAKGIWAKLASSELRQAVNPTEKYNTYIGDLVFKGDFAELDKIRKKISLMSTSADDAFAYLNTLFAKMQKLSASTNLSSAQRSELESRMQGLSMFLEGRRSNADMSARAINLYIIDVVEAAESGLASRYL